MMILPMQPGPGKSNCSTTTVDVSGAGGNEKKGRFGAPVPRKMSCTFPLQVKRDPYARMAISQALGPCTYPKMSPSKMNPLKRSILQEMCASPSPQKSQLSQRTVSIDVDLKTHPLEPCTNRKEKSCQHMSTRIRTFKY